MGREIRKVPKGWEHPKNEKGNYQPMRDEYFEDAFDDWDNCRKAWLRGEETDAKKYNYPLTVAGYTDWNGRSPDPEQYRQIYWTEAEANCFQMYENVSEGTPVSPVFESLQELEDWLVKDQGHSRQAAHNFCESGYAPSMTLSISPTGAKVLKSNVDTCE